MSEVMNVRGDECRGDECRTIQFFPPDGATCIIDKFGHQMALLAFPHGIGLPHWGGDI